MRVGRFSKLIDESPMEDVEVSVEMGVPEVVVQVGEKISDFMKDCDDIVLLMISRGISEEDVDSFMKVRDALSFAKYTRELTPVLVSKWSNKLSLGETVGIDSEVAGVEYKRRTSVEKSIVGAVKALAHLMRNRQSTLQMEEFHEMCGNSVSEEFISEFADYQKLRAEDFKESKANLDKNFKSGCDVYKSKGGYKVLDNIDVESNVTEAIDKVIMVSKILLEEEKVIAYKTAAPFHYMYSGVDSVKGQSYVDTATRVLATMMPETVFYNIDDSVSNIDLSNRHLVDGPIGAAPYLCFSATGVVGDVRTNVKAWKGLGICIDDDDYEVIGDASPKYKEIFLDFKEDEDLIVGMSEGAPLIIADSIKFGNHSVKNVIPANLSRTAGLKDLEKSSNSVHLILDSVIAGFCKKSSNIFKTWRFYLIEPLSGLSVAVPVKFVKLFPILLQAESAPVEVFKQGFGPLAMNTVARYEKALMEFRAYATPWLWKLYNDPMAYVAILEGFNLTLERVYAKPINGASFRHILLLWEAFSTQRPKCRLVIGAEKSNDIRVSAYVGNAELNAPKFSKIDDSQSHSYDSAFCFVRRKKAESIPTDSGGSSGGGGSVGSVMPSGEGTSPVSASESSGASMLEGFMNRF